MERNRKNKYEIRTYDITELNVVTRDDDPDKIVGHAAVFNREGDGGWFREQVAPGAFAKSIEEDDIRALINHDRNLLLGRNTAGTLELKEDSTGLMVSIIPPDTQYARDVKVSIGRGDMSGMSIGFEIEKETREEGEDGELDLFTIERAKLWDVSPVTFPFYEQTDVSLRDREAWRDEPKQRERPNILGKRLQLLKREFESRRIL